jgi:hypothetical protein
MYIADAVHADCWNTLTFKSSIAGARLCIELLKQSVSRCQYSDKRIVENVDTELEQHCTMQYPVRFQVTL